MRYCDADQTWSLEPTGRDRRVWLCSRNSHAVAEFPGTIVITADGLEQVHWLWKNKLIQWSEIEEINTGEKSRAVTITATNGTKIVHSRQLPDRPRLLFELKQHCGENLPPDFPREPIAQ